MAFDGGISASYLASFRPVAPVPGFESVLSNQASEALAAIPRNNAALLGQLAVTGLNELGATERLQRNLDAVALENELTRGANRKFGALRMAGDLLAAAFPGGGEAGVTPGDPLALLSALQNSERGTQARRTEKAIRGNAFLAEALKGGS